MSTLHAAFEAHARLAPGAPAVSGVQSTWSYADLDLHANAIAGRLGTLGIGPDDRVGLCAERSPRLVAGMLGILKAGGAYVPVDPSTPGDRTAFMLADAGVRAVVTTRGIAHRLPADGLPLVYADDPSAATTSQRGEARGDSLAYTIYTSGTTGRPKGVMVEHASVLRLMEVMRRQLGVTERTTVLGLTTPAFDLSVPDFFLPLTTGAHLLLASERQTTDPDQLAALLGRATLAQATPATWRMLLDAGWTGHPGLTAVSGGDALSPALAEALLPAVGTLWNFYGPTEATVWATSQQVEPGRPIVLGEPLPGVTVSLRDDDFRPVPDGETGEICIGGWGVARGYLGRPALTAERFVTNADGQRLYRTGDLARQAPGEGLRFAGRADTQVKMRGYRIELGEIESVLGEHPAVAQCAVLAREDHPGDVRLVAYVVGAAEPDALGRHLAARLPGYMLPTAYVALDAMPLTDRHKVDRSALPPPLATASGGELQTGTERLLAALWRGVLGTEGVGRDDTFVSLGGHSLLAVRLAAEVRRRWGFALGLGDVYRHPSLGALAAEIDRRSGSPSALPTRTDDLRGPLSFAQRGLWFLDRLHPGSPLYTIAEAFRLRGPLDADALQIALDALARRHPALRTRLVETDDGEPQQVVDPAAGLPLRRLDADPAHLDEVLVAEARRPFRLADDLPARATLLRLGDEDHALLLALHHTAADGWSLPILYDDLARLYAAALEGRAPREMEPTLRPIDYARWQRERLGGPRRDRHLRYWRATLAAVPPVLALPTDNPRSGTLSDAGARISMDYPLGLAAALDAFARREGVTPFVAGLTAYAGLLAHLGGEPDLVVGVNTSGRERAGAEGAVGLYVSMAPVRVRIDAAGLWRDALAAVAQAALAAFEHAEVPFEHIVEAAAPERRPGVSPLVQTVFSLDDARDHALRLPHVGGALIPIDRGTTTFDLVVDLVRDGDDLRGVLEYRTSLFDPDTAGVLLDHYGNTLHTVLSGPESSVADLGRVLEGARLDRRAQAVRARDANRQDALSRLRRRPL